VPAGSGASGGLKLARPSPANDQLPSCCVSCTVSRFGSSAALAATFSMAAGGSPFSPVAERAAEEAAPVSDRRKVSSTAERGPERRWVMDQAFVSLARLHSGRSAIAGSVYLANVSSNSTEASSLSSSASDSTSS
jgi:hypothetical protein